MWMINSLCKYLWEHRVPHDSNWLLRADQRTCFRGKSEGIDLLARIFAPDRIANDKAPRAATEPEQ